MVSESLSSLELQLAQPIVRQESVEWYYTEAENYSCSKKSCFVHFAVMIRPINAGKQVWVANVTDVPSAEQAFTSTFNTIYQGK